MPIEVVHYTDPGCPWAYSAEPFVRALEWRYGDGLVWRTAMIGLAEDPQRYVDLGYTGALMTQWHIEFRDRFGMPFSTAPRERPAATGPACRLVVSARRQGHEAADAVLRALRFSWFTDPRPHDDLEVLEPVVRAVPGIDADAVLAGLGDPAVEEAYLADKRESRTILPPAAAQGKTANSDGEERYTAPSLTFAVGDRMLVAAGWQPLAAYDVCVANLDPDLPQRGPAGPAESLPAFPRGLTTYELALIAAGRNDEPDRAAVEAELVQLAADGRARRVPLGSDALWLPA